MELRAEDLTVSRGDLTLARGVSFTLAAGDALTVMGPNGSGKSTLLRALIGLHAPDEGTVTLRMGDGEVPVGENAHYLGHGNALKADLTVRENLRFWARLMDAGGGTGADEGRDGGDDLVAEAVGALDLGSLVDLPAGVLSAGQRRRVALARLWVAPRPLWVMDEPTAALDRRSEGSVRDMIGAHRGEGGMVVAATHLDLGLEDARTLALGGPVADPGERASQGAIA